MGVPIGMSEGPGTRQNIDWLPLLIVIGAVYLISSAMVYGVVNYGGYYGGDFRIEFQVNIVLSFVAATMLIIAIASVIYRQIEQAKKLLIIGMLIVIVMYAIRTEAYLRASM